MTEASPDKASRVSATSIAAGDVLGGKYRIDGELGVGGMGVVLAATHLELDAPVAIKVIRDEFARNEEVVGRMLFEARAAAKLRSTHVVRVLDVARLESGAPYIVMERLRGRDLASLLVEHGPLPVQEAVDYVLQACEGLLEAHALGIVHRDLKPENLFRAETHEGSVIKVLDFGISKDTGLSPGLSPRSVMTTAGYAVGSPYYMSPEQMRALDVDARADIWSLGAILYELLSGHCPFEGESLPVVCASVLSEAEAAALASVAPQVPEGLSVIVAGCLRKDREQRFGSVVELAAPLRAFASTDGQRSADRSSRLSVVSSLKSQSERPTVTPAPMAASTAVAASFRPASPRYLPVTAALLVIVGVALGWAALRAADAPRNTKPEVAAAAPPVANPATVTTSASNIAPAEPRPGPALATSAEATGKSPNAGAERAHATKRVAASTPIVAPPAPTSPLASALTKPAVPPSPSNKPPANAWDPERLGGRY